MAVQGKELKGEVEGILAMKQSWPSIMRTLFGDHKRYEETYFSAYKVCCVLCCAGLCWLHLNPVYMCPAIATSGVVDSQTWGLVYVCATTCVCVCAQGYYFTGDGCRRDEDGYFWITGQPAFSCLCTV